MGDSGHDLPYSPMMAGIMTSLLNPAVYLWWAVIGSVIIMNSLKFGAIGFGLLIPIHWLYDLAWYSFVSLFVYRTHSLWGKKFQQGLFILSNLIFFGFGAWFLTSALRMLL